MIIHNRKKDISMELELQETETDRAKGIEVKIHIRKKHLNAKFFHLWIEKEDLARFVKNLKKLSAGNVNRAELNSQDQDDLYMILMRKDQLFYAGVQVKTYNFTPVKLKNSVTLGFEIEPESLPPFITGLENILAKF